MREASADAVLLLDDDAALLDGDAVERALAVLAQDREVAAVAFAQANEDGRPWPEAMQPARGQSARYVAAFIGFAHLLRRDVFLRLGGYRERFVFYGEEKDYCLRLLDDDRSVVYLPDALVIHAQDASGRTPQRYLRYVTRNDCLHALYNEPIYRVLWLRRQRIGGWHVRSVVKDQHFGGQVRDVLERRDTPLERRRPVTRRDPNRQERFAGGHLLRGFSLLRRKRLRAGSPEPRTEVTRSYAAHRTSPRRCGARARGVRRGLPGPRAGRRRRVRSHPPMGRARRTTFRARPPR
jgi:hypothetical protein